MEPFDTKARKRKGNPQSVKQILALVPKLSPKYQQVVWSLFISGMGTKEYLGAWEVKDGALYVHGTKRASRDRVIPLVEHPIRHHIHGRSFAQVLDRASGGKVQPYDLRRSFAKLMEDAGISRTRRRMYMGHAVGDVTEGYERHEVDEYLAADAQRLRQHIDRERAEVLIQSVATGAT
jgi:integrase